MRRDRTRLVSQEWGRERKGEEGWGREENRIKEGERDRAMREEDSVKRREGRGRAMSSEGRGSEDQDWGEEGKG